MRIICALMLVMASAFVTGCGACSRVVATYSGYDKMCVDGVSYIQFTSGATVQVDLEGKPVRCFK